MKIRTAQKFLAILFDLDGVILDSSDAWHLAVNATLKKFGKKAISKKKFLKAYWGPNLRESFKKINLSNDAIEDCNSQYYKFVDKLRVFHGAEEILKIAKEKFKVALVTNTPREITIFSLEKFSLLNYFDVVVAGDDVKNAKPSPDMILKACKRLKVKPENSILVGDTYADVIAGKKAGCFVIGLKIDADIKIENLEDVRKFLSQL
ncbi:MAG: HAD family hydrolase [Candidatus Altiarchaeota archaeon]